MCMCMKEERKKELESWGCVSWPMLKWSCYPLKGIVWVKGATAEICWWWPQGQSSPAVCSAELGCMDIWKSHVLPAAAQAVQHSGDAVQKHGRVVWPCSGFSLNFILCLKCLWFWCEMTGDRSTLWSQLWKSDRIWERGCPQLHSCSGRAGLSICPCRRAAGGACEGYPCGPGSSGVDTALGPLALVRLSLLWRAGLWLAGDPPCKSRLSHTQTSGGITKKPKNRDGENIFLAERTNDMETAGLLLH